MLEEIGLFSELNLVGIVEDTENGYQKYQSKIQTARDARRLCPIVSVARSSLKLPEDFLVGQAIVFSAESVLREQKQVLAGKQAMVIGYGKIGSSIATTLPAKGVRVAIAEADPIDLKCR